MVPGRTFKFEAQLTPAEKSCTWISLERGAAVKKTAAADKRPATASPTACPGSMWCFFVRIIFVGYSGRFDALVKVFVYSSYTPLMAHVRSGT
jgi:hypothetical protein